MDEASIEDTTTAASGATASTSRNSPPKRVYTKSQQIVLDQLLRRLNLFYDHQSLNRPIKLFKASKTVVKIMNTVDYNSGRMIDIIFDVMINTCRKQECYIIGHCWNDDRLNPFKTCYSANINVARIKAGSPEVSSIEKLADVIMDKLIDAEKYICRGCNRASDYSITDDRDRDLDGIFYCDDCILESLLRPDCATCCICHEWLTAEFSNTHICQDKRHSIHKKCFLSLVDKHSCPLCRQHI